MRLTQKNVLTKIHLVISITVVVPIAFIYGYKPDSYFDITPGSIDENNLLMALFGLYLGFSALWILGIIHSSLLKPALISNVIFMLGLGLGRCLSMIIHGLPTQGFSYGVIGELILGFYGLWVLRADKRISSKRPE
jgi:hypothetical protein